jgi:hypothetical protein
MRKRFGRRRWGGNGDDGGSSVDPGQELGRVLRLGLVEAEALEPAGEIPATLAAVGTGTSPQGERLVVSVARDGGDAWLGALAVATQLAETEGFEGTAFAIARHWPLAARRRLGLLRPTPFRVSARFEPAPERPEGAVEAEPLEAPLRTAAEDARGAAGAGLWARALAALGGLAAKHGGALRRTADGIELVLLGRVGAVLRPEPRGLVLEVREPRRELLPLAAEGLADAFDRLEGSLRRVLGDRRTRESEAGVRWQLANALADWLGVRETVRWPLAEELGEAIDFVGCDSEGRGLVAVARGELGLAGLGPALDGWTLLAPRFAALVPESTAERPALVLAAERLDAAAARVLGLLALEVRWLEASHRGREPAFVRQPLPAPALDGRREGAPRGAPAPAVPPRAAATATPPPAEPARRSRSSGEIEIGRGERAAAEEIAAVGSTREDQAAPTEPAAAPEPDAEQAGRRRYEEFSLFDLGDAGGGEGVGAGDVRRRRRRRRGRGRGRGATAQGAERPDEGEEEEEEEPASARRPERGRPPHREGRRGSERGGERPRARELAPTREPLDRDRSEDEDEIGDIELDGAIAALADVPDLEVPEPLEEEDEDEEGEPETEEQRLLRREREQRRRARLAKTEPEPEAKPPPRPPRRRTAFLAHADRESVAAAVLLARDLRLVEGIWIYPQAELMHFFRTIVTDLREETPIVVVGFTASPAREMLQTASLYRDRLVWYDHHEWPPEDLEGLRSAIGADAVHVDGGAGSALAVALAASTRRSRFSDKLVDLLTGRFTTHDYSRWGRLWWSRLAQLAARHGERRTELEGLLVGRPSDLARQAARVAPPPIPEEVEWVAAHDFRIVHFGGHALVRVPVPAELDRHLTARVVRDRYRAPLSLAWTEGGDRFVLGADESGGRRMLDLGAMVDHLAEKFEWLDALPDPDHVARFRIAGATAHPERIDEVVMEIAMGRSILEG